MVQQDETSRVLTARQRPERTPSPRPRKHRKARHRLNCSECRRLKIKCDRLTPCSHCVRRGCAQLCQRAGLGDPHATSHEDPSAAFITGSPGPHVGAVIDGGAGNAVSEMRERLALLEGILERNGLLPEIEQTTLGASHNCPSSIPPSAGHIMLPTENNVASVTGNAGQSEDGTGLDYLSLVSPMDQHSLTMGPSPQDVLQMHHPKPSPFPTQGDTSSLAAPVGFITAQAPDDLPDNDESHGTLVVSSSGQSKYMGQTAATEWLKNMEMPNEGDTSPGPSRIPSPILGRATLPSHSLSKTQVLPAQFAFPFSTAPLSLSTASLIAMLPAAFEVRTLVDLYFRHFSWHHDIAPRPQIERLLGSLYDSIESAHTKRRIASSDLALLFSIMAVGAHYNLELASDDSSIEEYLSLAKYRLAKGDFISNNTIAGVQTLHIMGHLQLDMDSGRNGDSAWPLWGLAMRSIQAMGLHRDGARWNLGPKAIQERRRVFWECHSTDIRLSCCFSRPGSIRRESVDTGHPDCDLNDPNDFHNFHHMKYLLAGLFEEMLTHAVDVHRRPYSNISALYEKLCNFERDIPFALRCRPVMESLPSLYPDPESAKLVSPPVDKRNYQQTLQQYTLALNVSEAVVFLHRPYFARALHENASDPGRSRYGPSYIAVVERCNALILIANHLQGLYPQIAARTWWIWREYHAFSSAACMGALISKNPNNALAPMALSLIDSTISIYTSAVQRRTSPRMARNLQWLTELRSKVAMKMTRYPNEAPAEFEDDGDVGLLGWRVRLIRRAQKGSEETPEIEDVGGGLWARPRSSWPSQAASGHGHPTTEPVVPPSGHLASPRSLEESGLPPYQSNNLSASPNTGQTSVEDLLGQFWDPFAAQYSGDSDGNAWLVDWSGLGLVAPEQADSV